MKRSWIGLGLLLFLLASSLPVTWAMERIHRPIAQNLITAGDRALAGNWTQAETLYRQAEEDWQKSEPFRACFADHKPMEEIDAAFARLEMYAHSREKTAFAAACAETARKATAMADAHGLKWENLF